jgi:ABC-type multidrug transport system ATPase subunit
MSELSPYKQGGSMLEPRNVSKRFSGSLAVDRVSFCARAGEVTGYLGPNGSGTIPRTAFTTFVRIWTATSRARISVRSSCVCADRV